MLNQKHSQFNTIAEVWKHLFCITMKINSMGLSTLGIIPIHKHYKQRKETEEAKVSTELLHSNLLYY